MQSIPGVLLTGLACLSFFGPPAPTTTSGIQFFAGAFGSSANVANTVLLGKTGLVTLGTCGTLRAPLTKTNTVASVDARPQAATGLVNTVASAADVSGTQTARASATVAAVRLLAGLVSAREVRAVSTTTHDFAGFRTSGDGSRLSGLVVAGVPILTSSGPNTRIDLPGLGFVVLNEQIRDVDASSASLTVNMIHVVATVQNPLVPVGANLVVGHATSRLVATDISGTLGGTAYGTFARAGRTLLAGKSAPVSLGCAGTNGAVDQEFVATVSAPQLVTGTVVDTASGIVTTSSASGETTSTVQALDLLSSLVTADVVHADAHAFTDGSVFTFRDDGSRFTNLSVRGFPSIGDDVPANTMVSIAGLGTLWLKREIVGPNGIEIRMIELVVNQANAFGLQVGAVVQVAVAHASAH